MTLKSRIFLGGALLLLGAGLLTTSGCKKKPSCELLYTRLDKCVDDFDLKKDKFVKRCNKKKDKAIVKEQIKCSKITDCDKFKTCIKESSKRARAKSVQEDFEKNLKEGKIKQVLLACKYDKKYLTEDLKKKCGEIQNKQWTDAKTKAIKVRDAGVKNDWELCTTLKTVAAGLGDDAKKKEAKELCAEMSVAKNVAATLKKAQTALSSAKPAMPFECSWTITSLDKQKVKTAWMAAKRKALVDTCYTKLGKKVLEAALAKKPHFCPFGVSKVYMGVKEFHLNDPAIKGLIEKLMPICKKSFEIADKSLAKQSAAGKTASTKENADTKKPAPRK